MPLASPTEYIASFDDLIRPLSARDFLRDVFGKRALYVPGTPNRFDSLLSWDALNAILAERRVESLDLRLTKQGNTIPRDAYTRTVHSEFLGMHQQLDARRALEHFREGASLVINRFRDMHGPSRALSDILEETFRSYIEVVVFAGWHDTEALAPHWDSEDTFVLQVDGVKHWRVWWPTRPHPLMQDRERNVSPPSELFWEGDLRPGDLLHIPRGWWHVAKPAAPTSLHLTFGVRPPTGIDLARAVLTEVDALRANVPQYSTESEQREYLTAFGAAVREALEKVSLASFFAEVNSKAPSRTYLGLPWSAVPELDVPDTAQLRWLPQRRLELAECDGALKLEALGRTFSFSALAQPVLRDLMDQRATTLHGLCERHPHADVRSFVAHLLVAGLVSITQTPRDRAVARAQ
jgi:ribosomal protein L16 Arg81 hydroxylase